MHKRSLAITLLCASLPVMMAALLSPGLPALQLEFAGEPEIQLLSKLVLMTPALAIACSAGILGILVDRWGRYPILIVSLLIFGLFGVQGYWADDVYGLIVTRFFFGLGVAGIMTTTSTSLADHYDGPALRRMLGLQAGLMGLWGIAFQVGGGFLAESSWRSPFLLYAVAFPLVFLVILEPAMRTGKPIAKTLLVQDHSTRKMGLLLLLLALSAIVMSLFALIPVQGPLFFHSLQFSPRRTAFLISTLTASSCAASLTLAMWRRRLSTASTLGLGLFALAFSFNWLGHADRWRDLLLSMMGIGAGVGLVIPCISALIATLSPPGQKGKILGALLTVNYVGQFLAPIWSQAVLKTRDNHELFMGCGLICGSIVGLVAILAVFNVERRRRES